VQGGSESALKTLGHELAFHWSAVQGQPRRLLAMRFGLPQPFGRSADVLFGGVQRFAALCLFAPCTRLQVTTNVDGANSTKPLL